MFLMFSKNETGKFWDYLGFFLAGFLAGFLAVACWASIVAPLIAVLP